MLPVTVWLGGTVLAIPGGAPQASGEVDGPAVRGIGVARLPSGAQRE
jgi:hypothetical protein